MAKKLGDAVLALLLIPLAIRHSGGFKCLRTVQVLMRFSWGTLLLHCLLDSSAFPHSVSTQDFYLQVQITSQGLSSLADPFMTYSVGFRNVPAVITSRK